jgi:trk system potassium uptake protein TrkH
MLIKLISRQFPWLKQNEDLLRSSANAVIFFISLLAFGIAIWDTGFPQSGNTQHSIDNFYKIYFACNGLFYVGRALLFIKERHLSAVAITNLVLGGILLFEFSLSIILGKPYILGRFLHLPPVYKSLAVLLFIFEFSRLDLFRFFALLNPPQIFIVSFGSIIITGALFLMMPQATTKPIAFIDALFTSTSAVCVTGLIVVDTATRFTMVGKAIILALIQIGGLGIMIFTSFFAVFFKGTQSFREKQILKEWLNDPSLSSIKKTLSKVVLFMLLAESIGIILLYSSIDPAVFEGGQRFRFAVFHSISAFCNAGFSTLTDNLYDSRVRFNSTLLYIISFLIIIGGIGFPVVLNLYDYIKAQIRNFYEKRIRRFRYVPAFGLLSINARIVMITTLILVIGGTVSFFIFEYDDTLKDLTLSQKIATSFLGSVTPRTAGYNSVNMTLLSAPTILLTIALMWIGASPVSTGGGIKTTTFAVALMNISKIIRGKDRIEIFRREIDPGAVGRAFAIMFFSLIILSAGSFIIYLIEPNQSMLKIVFECFSAYGTVGLSLGITSFLSWISKTVLILLMFTGRMGTITLLMIFISQPKSRPYRFPSDTIVIT